MNITIFRGCSIKTRVSLFTLLIFVVSIWTVTFYASRMLREDMQRVLGEQQFSTVSLVAAQFDGSLNTRLNMLEHFAARITPTMLRDRVGAQVFLEDRLSLREWFNAGAYVTDTNGRVMAAVPTAIVLDAPLAPAQEHVAVTLQQGQPRIGKPVLDPVSGAPMVSMAVPIFDAQRQVVGALVGVIDLSQPNFLSKISANSYGKTGGYLIVAPQHRLVITATDPRRVMETLPPAGTNRLLDRFLQGYEGSQVLHTPHGVEVLASVRRVPRAGWNLVVMLPTEEAFAPIRDLQHRVGLVSLLLTLLAAALTWWMLRRELSPMLDAARALAVVPQSGRQLQPLAVARQDEVGALIGSFNRLVDTLSQREGALKDSETRFRTLMEQIPSVAVQGYALDGTVTFWNAASEKLYGFSAAEALGGNLLELIIPPEMKPAVRQAMQQMTQTGQPIPAGELALQTKSGARVPVLSSHALLTPPDRPAELFCLDIDLSEIKNAQQQLTELARRLQLSEDRLTHILDETQIQVWTFDGTHYIFFNRQWFDFTGQKAQGELNIERWTSVVHPDDLPKATEIWLQHWASKTEHDNYFRLRRHDGVYRDFYCHAVPVFDAGGAFQYFQGFNLDITERKQMEEQVRQLAFYDALTGLPNRRLLEDRLSQTLEASSRSGLYGALMFLDLDNFKPLNDAHGHGVGDLLLMEVASRLSASLRKVDTVSRFGGDEFVVMLSELTHDRDESAAQARGVAEKIRASLAAPYHLKLSPTGQAERVVEHRCSASIGMVLFVNHAASQADILKWADLAMYQAKVEGRNAVRFYQDSDAN